MTGQIFAAAAIMGVLLLLVGLQALYSRYVFRTLHETMVYNQQLTAALAAQSAPVAYSVLRQEDGDPEVVEPVAPAPFIDMSEMAGW